MSRTVIWVTEVPLSQRDCERYGVSFFRNIGFETIVIEVTSITNPALAPDDEDISPLSSSTLVLRPRSITDLNAVSGVLKRAWITICLVGFTGDVQRWAVYRWLSRSGVDYIVLAANAYPGMNKFIGEKGKLLHRCRHVLKRAMQGQIRVSRSIVGRLPRFASFIRASKFVIHGGSASTFLANKAVVGDETIKVFAHSMDYDKYLSISRDGVEPKEYAVFVDENVGFHWDTRALSSKPIMDSANYYPMLRRALDHIENKLGLSVVIAANPRATYSTSDRPFGNRMVIPQSTGRLISSSRLVIGHRSTALGFAVMFGRPVLLLTARAFSRHWGQWAPLLAFSEALGKPLHYIDSEVDIDPATAFEVDEKCYSSYFERFIKIPGTPELPFWEIVLSVLEGRSNVASRACGELRSVGNFRGTPEPQC